MLCVLALAGLPGLTALRAQTEAVGYGLFELDVSYDPRGNFSNPRLVSEDGSIVGGSVSGRGFRWENGVSSRLRWEGAPSAMTPDGTMFVGSAMISNRRRAVRWVGLVGEQLGTLGGRESEARAVSADGRVIVGASQFSRGNDNYHAFRWENGVMNDIDTLGGLESRAAAVSADGSVVVGTARPTSERDAAFRWQDGVMVELGTLGGRSSEAQAVSADGRFVAGNSSIDSRDERYRAFRWSDGVMTDLGSLGGDESVMIAMNSTGAVIVGSSTTKNGETHAFRWANGTMRDLGTFGGSFSEARAVSSNGRVVVGVSSVEGGAAGFAGARAFRWEQGVGMQSIKDWLISTGVPVSGRLVTAVASGVSGDGMTVVGLLANQRAFIARSAEGLVTVEDMQESLQGGIVAMNMGRSAGELVMHGAHGNPLDRRTAVGRFTAWAAGDLAADHHGSRDGSLGVGELGGGYNFGPLQANLAVGLTKGNQDTFLGGNADFDGAYIIADLIAPVPQTPLVATLTVFHQQGELHTKRGYLNAGLVNYASGSTDIATYGGAARLDWENAFAARGFSFTPYVKLSLTHTRMDGYVESGGFFPATYDARNDTTTELTVGVNMARPLTSRLTLRSKLEGVHRFEERGSSIDGEIAGVSTFSLPGDEYRQDWLRGAVGLDYATASGVFSVSINATSRGEASSVWLATSYQIHF